jgi:uncharacterized membrane protein
MNWLSYRNLIKITLVANILLFLATLLLARQNLQALIYLISVSLISIITVLAIPKNKKIVALVLFILATLTSFSHFILNYATLTQLVISIYIYSFILLISLLITNFNEKL